MAWEFNHLRIKELYPNEFEIIKENKLKEMMKDVIRKQIEQEVQKKEAELSKQEALPLKS